MTRIHCNLWSSVEHFSPEEFWCKCECNHVLIDMGLIYALEKLRYKAGNFALRIVSGYRCAEYNKKCGGAKRSQHPLGRAADILTRTLGRQERLFKAALTIPAIRGIGRYDRFLHIDVRLGRRASWDKRTP